jgi:hypothetical protein
MPKSNSRLSKAKAAAKALIRTVGPDVLNNFIPGLGTAVSFGMAYKQQRAAQNLDLLLKELTARVDQLEEKLTSITNGAAAEKIEKIVRRVVEEPDSTKISFYAAVIAGELSPSTSDWDEQLQTQFVNTIGELAGPELIILEAMCERKPGESLPLPERGKTWLDKRIIVNPTWLAWIDSLVRKGLVVDASIERLRPSVIQYGSPSGKSGSAYRLSNFARSMIEFMVQMQKAPEQKS